LFLKKIPYIPLIILCLFSCDNGDPPYPAAPIIEFKELVFKERHPQQGLYKDSLILTFTFQDGDQDLGLAANDLDSPFHYHNLFLYNGSNLTKVSTKGGKVTGNYPFQSTITINSNSEKHGELVTIRTKSKHGLDFLPAYSYPLCLDYLSIYTGVLVHENDSRIIGDAYIYDTITNLQNERLIALTDTFYYEINNDHYNLTVDFLYKNYDGSWEEYDWVGKSCMTYAARFPRIPFTKEGPFRCTLYSKWKGEITYAMTSDDFVYRFGWTELKLRVTVRDRALHTSNTIETAPFSTR
jgi:hypothetical protein